MSQIQIQANRRQKRRSSGSIWIRHSDWIKPLILFLSAIAVVSCGKPSVVGLRGQYPPVIRKSFSLQAEFVEIDSLTPTFRWEPLVLPSDDQLSQQDALSLNSLTYELRVWRTVVIDGTKLFYSRDRLKTTEHRIEKPLEPNTRYFWSVRAHFDIGGRKRTTEWALAGYPLRHESVPNKSCLRFKTPFGVEIH